VFDRVTGQPVWPIEERPVPQSAVPGEKSSPTQPIPTKPPPFDRQGLTADDLIDFTPEIKAEALKVASRYQLGPLYMPPIVSKPDGPVAALVVPSQAGGANWPGGAFDPETGVFYLYSSTQVSTFGLVHDPKRSDMDYILGNAPGIAANPDTTSGFSLSVQGLPLVRPPWGRVTAIDLNRGEILWQVPHGDTPDLVTRHPALKGVNIPKTGRPGRVGTLVTKSLVIVGDTGFSIVKGVRGAMLRAYDKRTGDQVGIVPMPAPQTGSPMSYVLDGRQYLVVAVSGGTYPGELLAYRVP
jgi:quinoprotein glucose dehydrogenase